MRGTAEVNGDINLVDLGWVWLNLAEIIEIKIFLLLVGKEKAFSD